MQKYTKRHLQLPDMFLQHVNSGGEGGVVLFYSCVPARAHDQLLWTFIDVHDDIYVDDDIDVDVAVDVDRDVDIDVDVDGPQGKRSARYDLTCRQW